MFLQLQQRLRVHISRPATFGAWRIAMAATKMKALPPIRCTMSGHAQPRSKCLIYLGLDQSTPNRTDLNAFQTGLERIPTVSQRRTNPPGLYEVRLISTGRVAIS
jgi:hypothetical protein